MKFRRRARLFLEADEVFVDAASILDPADRLERKMERPLGRLASFLFLLVVMGGMTYLASRAADLQVASGNGFFSQSEENRFAVRPIFSPRGMIYDRLGRPLVENAPSFGLVFDRGLFEKSGGDRLTLLRQLQALLKDQSDLFSEASVNLSSSDELSGSPRIILARAIPANVVLAISSHLDSLPGIQISESYQRLYDDPYAFSHLVGSVGKVSADDLLRRPELADEETVGKSGIEAFYDAFVRGAGGKKIVEVDSHGVSTRYRFTREPIPGDALTLTIDGHLQKIIYATLQKYISGGRGASVVAVDPASGAIRALVSFPGFDANSFGSSLSPARLSAVLRDPVQPLFNRAVSGEFPSGSTIKPLLAAAALQEDIIDPHKKIYDEGFISIPNPYHPGEHSVFPDWRKHGWVDMYDAIALSANVYFYMIGGGYQDQKGLGIERIRRYETAFGLGALTGIDLPGERPGLVPGPDWKRQTSPADPTWRIGDTYHTAIGQGGTEVTPLQMAMALSAIANGGTLWKPYILESARDADGTAIAEGRPTVVRQGFVSHGALEEVVKGMRQTVTSGTARLLQDVPMSVAAKTGTAQTIPGKLPHAWVTAFIPVDHPELVLVVMVEYAGEGATVAVPITNEILQWYAAHRGP